MIDTAKQTEQALAQLKQVLFAPDVVEIKRADMFQCELLLRYQRYLKYGLEWRNSDEDQSDTAYNRLSADTASTMFRIMAEAGNITPDAVRGLIRAYLFYADQDISSPEAAYALKTVHTNLRRYADGAVFEKAFDAKSPKGRPPGTTSYPSYKIAAHLAVCLKRGLNVTQATESCLKQYVLIEDRQVQRIIAENPIPDFVDLEFLEDLEANGYTEWDN